MGLGLVLSPAQGTVATLLIFTLLEYLHYDSHFIKLINSTLLLLNFNSQKVNFVANVFLEVTYVLIILFY